MTETGAVFLVDDDAEVRIALARSIALAGHTVRDYDSAEHFLAAYQPTPGCLVLDVRMTGMSGLELQDTLKSRDPCLPIIFITGHGTIPMSVRAVKQGALDFLEKPFTRQVLLARIDTALTLSDGLWHQRLAQDQIVERYRRLTPREREIMGLMVLDAGRLTNKMIARRLGISFRTVDHHRARVMEKMQASTLAALIEMAQHDFADPPAAG